MAREQDKKTPDPARLEQLRNDPKLRMFLRQAGAIIAMERGFSKQSREKLQSLAIRLELSDDQFHHALEELQSTGQLPTALNHWERSFVVFLEREFEGFRGKVLSMSVEHRAIDLAARKYQISEVRACQLIQKTATELGIGRMAEGDAEQFGQRLIVDTLGTQCSLERGQLTELQRIGGRWGLSHDVVARLVNQTIADNSKTPTGQQSRQWLLLIPAVCILVALLWVLAWQNGWLQSPRELQAGPNGQPAINRTLNKVDWWNEELDQAAKAIDSRQFSSIENSLQSADPELRRSGLGQLIEFAQAARAGQRVWLNHLISLLYFYDPDPTVTDAVLESLNNSLQPVTATGSTVDQRRQIDSGFWAVQMLVALMGVDTTGEPTRFPERMETIREIAFSALGPFPVDPTPQEFFVTAYRRMAIDLWNQVTVLSSSSVDLSASLIAVLKNETAELLTAETLYQLELAAVLAVLDRDDGQWETIRDSISSLIRGSNQAQSIAWIDRLTKVQDRGLANFLAAELVVHCGVQPETADRLLVMKSLENYRTEIQQKPFSAVVNKNNECETAANRIRGLVSSTPEITPQLIAETVYAANLSLAFLAELDRQPGFTVLDELLLEGSPSLSQFPVNTVGSTSGKTAEVIPSPADQRMMDKAIERLITSRGNRIAARTSALESLVDLTDKFEDLAYADAQLLANYFLKEKELQEWLVVERVLPQFSNWPNLHLAFAELMGKSGIQFERVVILHRLMTGGQDSITAGANWWVTVSNSFVQSALSILQSRDYLGIDQAGLDWQRLQVCQKLAMANRSKILGQMLVSQAWSEGSYQQALSRLIEQRVSLERRPWFDNALIMASQAPQLVQRVVFNQLLIELIAMDLDGSGDSYTAQRDLVLGEYGQSMKKDLSLGRRLFLTEYTLLQLVSIVRQQEIDELLER